MKKCANVETFNQYCSINELVWESKLKKCERFCQAFDHATEWAQVVSQLSCGLQSERRLASGAKIQHNNVAVCQNQRLRQGKVWLETHLHFYMCHHGNAHGCT